MLKKLRQFSIPLKPTDRLVTQSYISPLLATFFTSVFLLLMQFLWKYIDDLVGKGLKWNVIAELLAYASAGLVPMALPLAVLLASIMTFGNLGEHNELMAMKSSGISLQRIMRPLIIFNLCIAAFGFYFNNWVLPYTNLQMGALLYDVRQQRPELNIKKGVFYRGLAGISIKVRDKKPEENKLYGVLIYDHRAGMGNLEVTSADSGTMVMTPDKRYLVFTLFNGESYKDVRDEHYRAERKNFPFQRVSFVEQKIHFELDGFAFSRTNVDLFRNNYQMLNLSQLGRAEDSLAHERIMRLRQHDKLFTSVAFYRNKPSDTLTTNPVKRLNTDSMYKSFSFDRKVYTLDKALETTRNAKIMCENFIEDEKSRDSWTSRHTIEWHRKFTLSVACLLLFFIGAPFGAIVRKGGLGMPVVISVFFFLFYYIISMMGEKSIKSGEMLAYQGMWLSSAILLPIGIYLTYKATHDSQLMQFDTYLAPFKNLIRFFKRKKQSNNTQPYKAATFDTHIEKIKE